MGNRGGGGGTRIIQSLHVSAILTLSNKIIARVNGHKNVEGSH